MKYLQLNDALYRYVCEQRSNSADPVLRALREETAALGEISRMQISEEQGALMGILVQAIGARTAIEVGTFTGYSSICVARALPVNGRLICVDESAEWTGIARKYWAKAGLEGKIDLRLGPACDTLKSMEPSLVFDFAFIDADKTEYATYFELLLPRVRSNGLILFDNMLWGGRLDGRVPAEDSGRALDTLNRDLPKDSRVETVLLPIADGIQLCRKR